MFTIPFFYLLLLFFKLQDDVSEAGTYTIEKDSPSPEVEQARNDIDRVFGVSGPESEVDATPATPRGNMVSEESWTTSSDAEKFKVICFPFMYRFGRVLFVLCLILYLY